MTERKVVHEIKLSKSIKVLLWGFVIAIALNAVPREIFIEDAMAQVTRSGTLSRPIHIVCSTWIGLPSNLIGCN